VKAFDWYCDQITNDTPIAASYRNTQNVMRRRFQVRPPIMAWLKKAADKTMVMPWTIG
jgi:hypothetical protein